MLVGRRARRRSTRAVELGLGGEQPLEGRAGQLAGIPGVVGADLRVADAPTCRRGHDDGKEERRERNLTHGQLQEVGIGSFVMTRCRAGVTSSVWAFQAGLPHLRPRPKSPARASPIQHVSGAYAIRSRSRNAQQKPGRRDRALLRLVQSDQGQSIRAARATRPRPCPPGGRGRCRPHVAWRGSICQGDRAGRSPRRTRAPIRARARG